MSAAEPAVKPQVMGDLFELKDFYLSHFFAIDRHPRDPGQKCGSPQSAGNTTYIRRSHRRNIFNKSDNSETAGSKIYQVVPCTGIRHTVM